MAGVGVGGEAHLGEASREFARTLGIGSGRDPRGKRNPFW
jgi:hypothetical protein